MSGETQAVEAVLDDIDMGEAVIAVHGPFELTATGMVVKRDATFEEWTGATEWALAVGEASPWWRSALLSYGERKYGEKYTQAVEATGLAVGTLMNEVYVANQIPPSRRREKVSFALHQEVAPLSPEEQVKWLDKVESEGLNREELRAQIKAAKAEKEGVKVQLWVIVGCEDADDQNKLYNRMLAEGRAAKMKVT